MFATLSLVEWIIIVINLGLLIGAERIYERFATEEQGERKHQVHLVRLINVLVIGLIIYSHVIEQTQQDIWLTQTIHILLLSYAFYLAFNVFSYFVHVRFGKQRKTESGLKISETYTSRGLAVFGGVLFFIIWLISIIQALGLNNLLEAGGVIGFVGVMLALTQGAWAPDIISGLIILNGNMVEEGDILQLNYDGRPIYAVVYKTKMFHTELLDLSNNHRMMIKNTQLRDLFIQNLSKFASAKGLREKLVFNIGYDVPPQVVRKLFAEVEKVLQQDYADYYESQHPIEIMIDNTGDHAVQWTVFFYTKEIRQLLRTRQLFREVVLNQSNQEGISLATPMTHTITSNGEVTV